MHTHTAFYYHLVWATKRREHFITEAIEARLYAFIGAKCEELGVKVFAVNGMPDHIHLVCAIPPRVSVAEFAGKVKGASSHWVNQLPDGVSGLHWQDGYGGLTLSKTDLARAIGYVQDQKRRHAKQQLWASLEDE